MIHRKGKAVVVTRGPLETKLRTEEDILDFVGTGDERAQVQKIWEQICSEKPKRKVAQK